MLSILTDIRQNDIESDSNEYKFESVIRILESRSIRKSLLFIPHRASFGGSTSNGLFWSVSINQVSFGFQKENRKPGIHASLEYVSPKTFSEVKSIVHNRTGSVCSCVPNSDIGAFFMM